MIWHLKTNGAIATARRRCRSISSYCSRRDHLSAVREIGIKLIKTLLNNCTDVRSFGLHFLTRHIPRNGHILLRIPDIGSIHIRKGESDLETVRQVFKSREYDLSTRWTFIRDDVSKRIMRRYSEILNAGKIPLIVDAGANIGSTTLWFKRLYPDSFVLAIEPEPENARILRTNVENTPGVSVFEAAIGSEPGFVSVENNDLAWAVRTKRANDGVPIVTMKDVFDSVPNGCPFIAKIDIEGFESDLFSKHLEWLKDVYVVFVEPHDWLLPGMTSRSFQQAFAQHEFEIFIRGSNLVYVRS